MGKRVALSELSPLMEETLNEGREVIFTITGNSMAPMLHHRKDGNYILHRIVGVKKEGYVTLGDHQCVKEYPVLPSQVMGIVKGFWRGGTYFSCDHYWYRIYCRLWVFGYPIRWMYLKGESLCVRMGKKLWGWMKGK